MSKQLKTVCCTIRTQYVKNILRNLFLLIFLSVRLLSFLRGHWVFSSPPQRLMTSDFKGFSIPDFIHYIFFPILILQKEPVFSLWNVQSQTRELLVPFLLRLWYEAVLVGGLNRDLLHSKPALYH